MLCAGRLIPDSAPLGQSIQLLLISDALHGADGSLVLHPSLMDYQSRLLKRRRRWFHCAQKTPFGWYAALLDSSPASLLVARCTDLPASARQAWVASPYHAQLGRDTVRLMPEGELAWSAADAAWLCSLLNPLLGEEGMSLHAIGAALLLACKTPLDTNPVSFAAIAGGLLPNRHPEGPDGGRLMRLLAEIQMSLHAVTHRTGQPTRDGQPDISGLWLWGSCALPAELPLGLPPVATLNPFLQALQYDYEYEHEHEYEHGAQILISEADRLSELLSADRFPGAGLPRTVLLAGAGHAVLLRRGLLPGFGKTWQAKAAKSEADLISRLKKFIDVA